MKETRRLQPDSWVIAGGRPNAPGSPLNTPLISASNFLHGGEQCYSREDGTETVRALESVVGGMEGGHGIAFSSGMAAAAAVLHTLGSGSEIALPHDCYHGVVSLVMEGEAKGLWTARRLDLADTKAWELAVTECDLVWIESPSNPLLVVADLPAICDPSHGRKAGALVCVDSTFATPLLQRPLAVGADVVMHSVTKYLGGHSDLLGGMLITATEDLRDQLMHTRTLTGAVPGALETFLALRGVRTVALRLEKSQTNAGALAQLLIAHHQVSAVRYPGLAAHPSHEVAARVLDGFGSMISFEVKGSGERADRLCAALRLVRHATSLGGVESTIERRSTIEGQGHLPPTLLRLSVGCENLKDLWDDLEQALSATATS